jgi:UDP-N-acetylglucosamine 2-epimerase (non-hydrolysing)
MLKIVIGTRPEIIKMSPIIRECMEQDIQFEIIHSGQHYSENMDKIFFDELELPHPDINLGISSPEDRVDKIGSLLSTYLNDGDFVLVQGDTDTVYGAAKYAHLLDCSIGHVEAGLRSYDMSMPEEQNRIYTDILSTYLFAPTEQTASMLKRERWYYSNYQKVFNTGNTIVDAVNYNKNLVNKKFDLQNYILVTVHRQENVNKESRMVNIFEGLYQISQRFKRKIIFPVHPNTLNKIHSYDIDTDFVEMVDPMGYLEFLNHEMHADLIITDSGGIQEEACILKVPCVTMRDNTERQETVRIESNILAGTDPWAIVNASHTMLTSRREWECPYGDGTSGKQIINILKDNYEIK